MKFTFNTCGLKISDITKILTIIRNRENDNHKKSEANLNELVDRMEHESN